MSSSNSNIVVKDCSPFLNLAQQDKDEKAIRKLCEYFNDTNEENKESKDDDDQIVSFRTTKYKGVSQAGWWAGRYIGVAKISIPITSKTTHKAEISIKPRFGDTFLFAIIEDLYNIRVGSHDANDYQSSEWFSSLLSILRRRIWADKCAKANRYGLPRVNVKRENQGASLRGSLNVRKTIMPWLLKKEVCTTVYEKTFDDNICRIVYEAHRILSQNVIENRGRKKTPANKKNQEQSAINAGFIMPPAVQDTINALNSKYKGTVFNMTEVDYKRIRYKSVYLSWKPLVDYSWGVIRNRQLGYKSSDRQAECIFVDMAEIWEAYLRKKLGEGLKDQGWRVLSVEECTYIIYERKFYERKIIPDIILERENGGEKQYMVFDAKYKRMRGTKTSAKYSDVDRSDLFQIHTYIHYVHTHMGKVVLGGLLYPITQKGKNEDGTEYEIKDINIDKYHSERLFGGSAKDGDTRFIIDGILCPEKEEDEKIDKKVESPKDKEKRLEKEREEMEDFKKRTDAMIGRIKKYVS